MTFGDNEDHNRREILVRKPHRYRSCIKSSRGLVNQPCFFLYRICDCFSHSLDDPFRLSIFVPRFDGWSPSTAK
jgi:hypothetical protein